MPANSKLKLAFFSPFNPIQSGISDYSEDLLSSLSHYAALDLFLDSYKPSNPIVAQNYTWQNYNKFDASRYDAFLLHMGNSAAHSYIYQFLQSHQHDPKAVLVLHDFVLHHFLIGHYLNKGKANDYIKLMQTQHGPEGERVACEVIKGRLPDALFQYPLSNPAIEAAGTVIVHSHYAANLIKQQFPEKKIGIVRMGVPLPPLVDRDTARQKLNLPLDQFIVTSLGHLNPYKRLDSALWAFKKFCREFPNARYLLVGSLSPNYDVKAMVRALGLENNVQIVGFVENADERDLYVAASDVCVNLRYPTAGETSASLLRIMGAGRPVLVSRTGTFSELPDDVCIKVDIDEAEEELLLEYLRLLCRDENIRLQIGDNARNYVVKNARLEDAAYDYYKFLCQVLNRPLEIEPPNPPVIESGSRVSRIHRLQVPQVLTEPAVNSLIAEVGQAAAEIGFDESDPILQEIAEALKFAGLRTA